MRISPRVRGAGPDSFRASAVRRFERSPLTMASKAGHLEVVRTLLAAGADKDHADWEGW